MDEERAGEPWRERYAHPCAWDQDFAPLAMTDLFAASVAAHPQAPLAAAVVLVVLRPRRAWRWGLRLWWGWRSWQRVQRWLHSAPR